MSDPTAPSSWEAFADGVEQLGFAVRRESDPPLIASQPETLVQPDHWQGKRIATMVRQAGQIVPEGGTTGSERRTLRLKNSGLPYGTTQTLWLGVQFVNPGEHARPHRHTPNALRFVMSGADSYTVVNGEAIRLQPGDFVLTPGGYWHEHENRGSEPCYWMDCLDIPLIRMLNVEFFENYPEIRQPINPSPTGLSAVWGGGVLQPVGVAGSRCLLYPWEEAMRSLQLLAALPPDPWDGHYAEYVDPVHRGHALSTIACYLQRLPPGYRTASHRHTHSTVYYVAQGRGQSTVDHTTLTWEQGDFFVVPSWAVHAHANLSREAAVLFSVTDRPVFEALGLEREWKADSSEQLT